MIDKQVVIDTVREMIENGDSELYIRTYLNDLSRSNDLSWEDNGDIYDTYVIPYTSNGSLL